MFFFVIYLFLPLVEKTTRVDKTTYKEKSYSLTNKSMEVEENNTKANWIESYFDVQVVKKKHELVEKY